MLNQKNRRSLIHTDFYYNIFISVKDLAGILEDLLEIVMNKRGGGAQCQPTQPAYPLGSLLLNEGLLP